LAIDATNAQAQSYLSFVSNRIQDAIAMYMRQAETYAGQKKYREALNSYQMVLSLDPSNAVASMQIANLSAKIGAPKKPTPPPPKPTPPSAQEIESLYKKGISLFAQEKYDEALKVFNKILALNPNHAGAKNYKMKTEARLKKLRGG